jgi:hypothetical protein
MIKPPEMETETGPELEPTGLVDPRAIHPGPDETQPEPRPGARQGPEEIPVPGTVSPPDPRSPAVAGAEGSGIVDPRASLPGPDLGPG